MSSIPSEGVVFSRPGRYYAGGEWVELMYATFTDYSGLVILSTILPLLLSFPSPYSFLLCPPTLFFYLFDATNSLCVFPIRYSPQTSICVYRANNSDALVPNGMNNRGVFDIFRSQVYDPMSGKSIANAFVEVQGI